MAPQAEPRYDEWGFALVRSGVSERIWALYKSDPARFKAEVKAYFALGYPSFTVVSASFNERIIWLRDEKNAGRRGAKVVTASKV